jgi:hypothetical protein
MCRLVMFSLLINQRQPPIDLHVAILRKTYHELSDNADVIWRSVN